MQWKKAVKQATKLENEIIEAQVDRAKNVEGSEARLETAVAKQEQFVMSGEGKVFKELLDLVEGPNGLKKLSQDIANEYGDAKLLELTNEGTVKKSLTKKMDSQLDRLTTNPFMKQALKEYIVMMRQNHHTLRKGVSAYERGIKLGLENAGRSEHEIKTIITKLREMITPSEKIGYFPHYRYDLNTHFMDNLMPKLEALNTVTRDVLVKDNVKIDTALADLNKFLDSSSYLLQRTKHREANPTDSYSKNFPVIMKRYTDEVSRFNFIAHSNMYAREALNNVKTMWHKGVDIDGYGRDVIREILDLHQAQTGSREVKYPEFDALQRTVLNLEFMSKIGLNPRGATRNLTQALLNVVQWGPMQLLRMKRWYKNEVGAEFESDINKLFEEVGLKYEDATFLMETGQRDMAMMGAKVKMGPNLELEFKKPGIFSKTAQGTGKLGSMVGKLHSKAENFNRKTTFKMAFYEAYKDLKFDGAFGRYFKEKYAKKHNMDINKVSEKVIEAEIRERAKRYAIRMTTLLHFDYSDISKNKIMRTGLGRAMLQFQHYGFEFFNYNLDVAKDAWHGRLNPKDPATHRAMQMGMVYGILPLALGFTMGNTNWFNLIQHNTAERAQQLLAIFTGDEEEIQEAFYGKPPELGFFGGPFFSDVLTAGQIFKWWDASDASLFQHGEQWEALAELEDDEKLYELAAMVSPSMTRMVTQTIPVMRSSGFFSGLQFELGIYPSSKIKDLKEKYYDTFSQIPGFKGAFDAVSGFDDWQMDAIKDFKAYQSNKFNSSSIDSRYNYIEELYKEQRKRDKRFRRKQRKRFSS